MSQPEPASPADVPTPGQVIAGKYRVERVIGAGGMGVVLAAQHLQLPQRVAIKFLRAGAAGDANAVERFLREARAAVALSSEHVARVIDVGTLDSGAPYLVMEYLEGIDLAQALHDEGPMPIAEALGGLLQACEAIAEAHAMGIVHRDLKPSNLFRSRRRDGSTSIKVLDFGISKVADFNASPSSDLTASGLVIGSPGYMSPEQVRSAKTVDARGDIWSLGVILYELLTGTRPFEGETIGEILTRIVSEDPPSVRQYRPEVPPGLAAVIAQCLERRVERRIGGIGELASKLAPYGPKDAQVSVERILRWTAVPAAGRPARATELALPAATVAAETGPPWLRSGSSALHVRKRSRWPTLLVAAGTGAAAIGGAYVAGRHSLTSANPSPLPSSTAPTVTPSASAVIPESEASSIVLPLPPPQPAVLSATPDASAPVNQPRRPPASPPLRRPPAKTSDDKDIF